MSSLLTGNRRDSSASITMGIFQLTVTGLLVLERMVKYIRKCNSGCCNCEQVHPEQGPGSVDKGE